jgi:hypothetical protein
MMRVTSGGDVRDGRAAKRMPVSILTGVVAFIAMVIR